VESHRWSVLALALLAGGCALDLGLSWPPETSVNDLRTCYPMGTMFYYYADQFEDEHTRKLMGSAPLAKRYGFLQVFGYWPPSRLAEQIAFAQLVPTEQRDTVRINLYSNDFALIHHVDLRGSRVVQCGPTRSVVVWEGGHAAEGTRARYRYTATHARVNGHLRVDSDVIYASAWLVFKATEHWHS
jgi:hypothetical protein